MSDTPKKRGRPVKEEGGFSYRDWYAANKEKLSKQRKEKYHSDSTHRAAVIARNKEGRRKTREARPQVSAETKHRKPVPMTVSLHGEVVLTDMYHIGTLAEDLNVSVPTVRGWELKGLLPKTPFVVSVGKRPERLYTQGMIAAVNEVLASRGRRVSINDLSFNSEISSKWSSIGVVL